jgi:hypothetical protein
VAQEESIAVKNQQRPAAGNGEARRAKKEGLLMNAFERIVHEPDMKVNTAAELQVPLVRQRVLTAEELEDLIIAVWREAKDHGLRYDPVLDSLSINDMAAVAIGVAMTKELGEAFEIPRLQYEKLLWEYVEHLAAEKLLIFRRTR